MMSLTVVDLKPHYGLISLSGPDAFTFLQGQLTCDMAAVNTHELRLGAYCNLKGRIRALLRIFRKEDTFYLQLPQSLLATILAHLKKYAMFSKVTLRDASTEWNLIGISAAPHNIPTHTALPVLALQGAQTRAEWITPIHSSNESLGYSSPDHILETAQFRSDLLAAIGATEDISLPAISIAAFEAWKLWDIRDGFPEIWPETSEQLLPHPLNLPALNAVNFNKGCYCGQEIIARMQYLGTLKRHMVRVKGQPFDTLPPPGTPLLLAEGDPVGSVVTAARTTEGPVEFLVELLDTALHHPFRIAGTRVRLMHPVASD